ncbi:WD40 repeat-containing protein [Cavenderia fasciculata]|uniref:WD40 repeat-containing protein n=1 Tax=Cavenderia fasciculata TaxID=261658 RepID=F4QCB2_CACFS|nr:WD40 repeat-containing protein [Cavenderia fasciculata]EGG14393.1 WD40 repeat-containing protein [Cavenderia fasciculata]|eukprot:XP_004353802.1 WD40 repeat-containing protein [Cavenderia fasciculata]
MFVGQYQFRSNSNNFTFDSFPYENSFEEMEEERREQEEEEARLAAQLENSKMRRLARFLSRSKTNFKAKFSNSSGYLLDRMPITAQRREKVRQATTNILALPDEILVTIIGFLDHSDIYSIMLVCHSWHRLTCEDFLWRLLYQNYFICKPNIELFEANQKGKKDDQEWHQLFTRAYVTEQRWSSDICTASVLRGHSGTVWTLINDTDNGMIYTGSYDKSVKVWNAKNRKCLYTLKGHSYTVQCLDVCNGFLATGSLDNTLRLWNCEKQTCQGIVSTRAHNFDVFCLQYLRGNANGRTVITGSSDATVKLWSVGELMDDSETLDERVYQSQLYYEGRRNNIVNYNIQPDDSFGSYEEENNIHPATAEYSLDDSNSSVSPSSLSDSQQHNLEKRQQQRHRNIENQTPIHQFKHESCVTCLQADTNGKLISGGSDKVVRLWDLNKMESIGVLAGHHEGIRCLQWEGNVVATGSNDCNIKLWDLRTNSCYRTLKSNGSVRSLCFNGSSLISASNDQTIRWWNMNNDKSEDLYTSQSSISCLSFADNTLMYGSSDHLVQILQFV